MTSISEVFRSFPLTVDRTLDLPARFHPNRCAIETDGETLSYAQLSQRIAARVEQARSLGAGRFERWSLTLGNSVEFFEWLFALSRLGCAVLTLPPDLTTDQFEALARTTRLAGCVEQAGPRRIENGGPDRVSRPSLVDHPIDVDPAILVRTSGSLGSQRSIVLQHHAVLANVIGNIRALGLRDTDKTLLVLPVSHAYGLNVALSHLAIGATVCLPGRPTAPPLLVNALERFNITTFATVPALTELLLAGLAVNPQRLAALRLVSIGAAYAPPAMVASLRARLPQVRIAITYGLTEAGPRVATRIVEAHGEPETRNVGAPLPNCEVSTDSGDDGVGEILVRSRSLMRSYAEDPYDEGRDHLLRTGDVGEVRPDGLHVIGRRDRSINRAGRRIAPEQIERVLLGDPRIRAARVEAERHPFWGEVPVAHVYVHDGQLQSV
ncbi:MAG: acyl--CoA ligase, partial [Candidatus Eremiobacteraeota bacterium]|nr:acyl--CoA ligase [Candidatus Eremiobacteraeota bacterium]